jgi:hypothetical protein
MKVLKTRRFGIEHNMNGDTWITQWEYDKSDGWDVEFKFQRDMVSTQEAKLAVTKMLEAIGIRPEFFYLSKKINDGKKSRAGELAWLKRKK